MSNVIQNGNYCVYVHTSPSGKMYVGQTSKKPKERWRNDGSGYLQKYKDSNEYRQPAFARAILKYGWENFKHEIIASNLTKEEADNFERLLIKKINTMNPKYGYNCTEGGSNGSPSEAIRKKLSAAHKNKVVSSETRQKISNAFKGENGCWYGKHFSKETRKKMSESHKGSVRTEESKIKQGETTKGENHYLYGKHRDEETKRKISESRKGLYSGANHPNAKKIVQYDQQGNLIKIWSNIKEAENVLKLSSSNICNCCKEIRKTCGGFIWRYYEDAEIAI